MDANYLVCHDLWPPVLFRRVSQKSSSSLLTGTLAPWPLLEQIPKYTTIICQDARAQREASYAFRDLRNGGLG